MIISNQKTVGATIFAVLLVVSGLALLRYPGSTAIFLFFDFSFLAMLFLALPQPRSYAYIFFSAMLFLGFWLKLMVTMLLDINFLEPVGEFTGSAQEWDRALLVASIGAIGVVIARAILFLVAIRFSFPGMTNSSVRSIPTWYFPFRKPIWIISVLLMIGLNVINLQTAFYQIGVNPRLILPAHLNVAIAWLINIGFALWFAVLIYWDWKNKPNSLANNLLVPIFEALVSSTSTLSRSLYFLHATPYLLAFAEKWGFLRSSLSKKACASLLSFCALCFLASLFFVSWLRVDVYYLGHDPLFIRIETQKETKRPPIPGVTIEKQVLPMSKQLLNLLVRRWIGLEGVLAVSSHPHLGTGLLLDAMNEDPKKGNNSLYQLISKSPYQESESFTFLTLPGIIAILYYSGSLLIVFMGVIFVLLLMLATEWVALRITGNLFLQSVVGISLANVIAQLNFPYLGMIFFLQLWVALVVIWAIHLRLFNILISKAGASPSDTVKE